MPELDSVRGLAIALVLVYHTAGMGLPPGVAPSGLVALAEAGWLGVHLFFVLSGFLITGILSDARESRRTDYFRRFYARRARRILPAYVALLFVLSLKVDISNQFLLLSGAFLSNVAPLFGAGREWAGLWSLAVEEQFYLLWPLAVWLLPRRAMIGVAVAMLLLSPLARAAGVAAGARLELFYHTWYVLDSLAAGALVALVLREVRPSREQVARWAVVLVALAGTVLTVGIAGGSLSARSLGIGYWDKVLRYLPWSILFAGALLGMLHLGSGPAHRWVTPRPLRYLGRISYGLYLIHPLVLEAVDSRFAPTAGSGLGQLAVRFALMSGISVVIAAVSRETFEAWWLGERRRPAPSGLPSATGENAGAVTAESTSSRAA
jgi:peptidoglycan/LPS O-acetylase OafA/YrhL